MKIVEIVQLMDYNTICQLINNYCCIFDMSVCSFCIMESVYSLSLRADIERAVYPNNRHHDVARALYGIFFNGS